MGTVAPNPSKAIPQNPAYLFDVARWRQDVAAGRANDPGVCSPRVMLLMAVAQYQGRNDASWASVATLGRAAGMSERSARRHLSALIGDGFLFREDKPGRPPRFSIRYMDQEIPTPAKLTGGDPGQPGPLKIHTARAGARIPEAGSARTQRAGAVAASLVSAGLLALGAGAPVFEPGAGWWLPDESSEGGVVVPFHAPPAPPAETTPATPATPSSPPSQPSPVTTPFLEAEEIAAPSSTAIPDADEEAEEPAAAQARWARAEPASGGSGAQPPPVIRSRSDQVRITHARAIPGNPGNAVRIPSRSAAPFEPSVYEADIARALSRAGFPELVPPPGALASDVRAAFVERLSRLVTRDRSMDVVLYAIGTAGRARTKPRKGTERIFRIRSTGRVVVLPHFWGFNTANADELDAMRGELYLWCSMERRRSIPASALRWFHEPAAPSAPAGEPEAPPASSARPVQPPARRPALTPRPGLRRAAPLPPASPEPQPGDDAHLAAVRKGVFFIDPAVGERTALAAVADERYLAFLADIARGKLSPEETSFAVHDSAAWMDAIDSAAGKPMSKTERRERVVNDLRKRAGGFMHLGVREWAEKKRELRAERKRAREARAA